MANLKSSAKDARRIEKRRALNRPQKTRLRTLQKKMIKLVSENKLTEARELFKSYTTYLDRAGRRNLIHKRQADRKKSRMALLLNKAEKSQTA
ncbi:MAG: 30S ribosomal protein S20 [Leptonema sp. (in: Bacteria)]|nr:30S ribosomal protein S20 [Leptonema sp. (in: bacteria)]